MHLHGANTHSRALAVIGAWGLTAIAEMALLHAARFPISGLTRGRPDASPRP